VYAGKASSSAIGWDHPVFRGARMPLNGRKVAPQKAIDTVRIIYNQFVSDCAGAFLFTGTTKGSG
jgi:hypothetical protein